MTGEHDTERQARDGHCAEQMHATSHGPKEKGHSVWWVFDNNLSIWDEPSGTNCVD